MVVERALELTLGVALLAAAGSALIALGAPGQGISVDPGRLVLATALLLPVALTFGAIGAAAPQPLPMTAAAINAVANVMPVRSGPTCMSFNKADIISMTGKCTR